MKRFVIGIAAMAVLVCAAYLVYGIFSFLALTQIRDVEFPAPNERQIAYVAEIAGMDAAALNIRQAERIVVSVSPHQSDSQIAFVYQSDGSALLDGAFSPSEPYKLHLRPSLEFDCLTEKLLSPFVRLYECENGRWILTVGNVPGSTADELAALGAD